MALTCWRFFLTRTSYAFWLLSMRPRKPGTRLKLSASLKQLGSGGAPCSSAVRWQLLSSPHYSQIGPFTPRQPPNTIQRSPVQSAQKDTWHDAYMHTFINHWKGRGQRRKEEQTPLRCWTWLGVPLDTNGCTQDYCCLWKEAVPRSLFIWTSRLASDHFQGQTSESAAYCTLVFGYCVSSLSDGPLLKQHFSVLSCCNMMHRCVYLHEEDSKSLYGAIFIRNVSQQQNHAAFNLISLFEEHIHLERLNPRRCLATTTKQCFYFLCFNSGATTVTQRLIDCL